MSKAFPWGYTVSMKNIRSFDFGGFPCKAGFYDKEEVLPEEADLFVADRSTASLISLPSEATAAVLEPGERAKQWPSVERILASAMEKGLARDSLMVGIGGGVVTDMTAFAASLYMRGCRVILIPTTLLAMVDASLGGKTGIDAGAYKNMIGTFYPAAEVRICLDFLRTLPDREFLNGLAEAIKTALIGDPEMLGFLRERREAILRREPEAMAQLIHRCVLVKGELVEEDLRESGRRALLNLGHTFGHALEAVTDFEWSHGAAVAWGMGKALDASVALGLARPAWAEEIKGLLSDFGFSLEAYADRDEILEAMKMDKKKKGGKLRYILPVAAGDVRVRSVEEAVIRQIL